MITFTPDNATQRVIINFSQPSLRVDFSGVDSCCEVLGFTATPHPLAYTTSVASIYGDTQAKFNHIESYLIHNDLANGIQFNGKFSNVLAHIVINSSPGDQIIYEPFQPVRIQAQNLAGRNINSIRSWITDQDSESLDFAGETSTYQLLIRYKM